MSALELYRSSVIARALYSMILTLLPLDIHIAGPSHFFNESVNAQIKFSTESYPCMIKTCWIDKANLLLDMICFDLQNIILVLDLPFLLFKWGQRNGDSPSKNFCVMVCIFKSLLTSSVYRSSEKYNERIKKGLSLMKRRNTN